jgi:hypothetical protein
MRDVRAGRWWLILRTLILVAVVGTAFVTSTALAGTSGQGHALCCDTDPEGPESCTNPNRGKPCTTQDQCDPGHTCCAFLTPGGYDCRDALPWVE